MACPNRYRGGGRRRGGRFGPAGGCRAGGGCGSPVAIPLRSNRAAQTITDVYDLTMAVLRVSPTTAGLHCAGPAPSASPGDFSPNDAGTTGLVRFHFLLSPSLWRCAPVFSSGSPLPESPSSALPPSPTFCVAWACALASLCSSVCSRAFLTGGRQLSAPQDRAARRAEDRRRRSAKRLADATAAVCCARIRHPNTPSPSTTTAMIRAQRLPSERDSPHRCGLAERRAGRSVRRPGTLYEAEEPMPDWPPAANAPLPSRPWGSRTGADDVAGGVAQGVCARWGRRLGIKEAPRSSRRTDPGGAAYRAAGAAVASAHGPPRPGGRQWPGRPAPAAPSKGIGHLVHGRTVGGTLAASG